MGSIASINREPNPHELYPSEAVAVQAKLRQAALAAQPDLVRKLSRTEAYGSAVQGGSDWYPAGISPWYLDQNGVIVKREVLPAALDSDWMKQFTVTKRDLHNSAILIQKMVRGHQVRTELHRQQLSARKIQRRFRQWRGAGNSSTSLPALATPTEAIAAERTLSADTWSVRRQHEVGGASKRDDFEFVWRDREVWNQDSSVYEQGDHHQGGDGADLVTETTVSGDGEDEPSDSSSDQPIQSVPAQVNSQSEDTEESVSAPDSEMTDRQQSTSSDEVEPLHQTTTEQSLASGPSSTADTTTSTSTAGAKAVGKKLPPPATRSTRPAISKTRGSQPVLSSTEVGKGLSLNLNNRDANVRRREGREDMYPAMTPGPLVRPPFNSQTRSRGEDVNSMFCTSDGVCGVRSVTLQSAKKRWIKPSREQRVVRTRNTEPVHTSTNGPPTTSTVGSLEEGKLPQSLQCGVTEPALQCGVTEPALQCGVTEPACPVQTVDSLIDLLSQGMVSEAAPPIAEEDEVDESAAGIEITPELVHTVHSVLRTQLTPSYLETKGRNYPENSFIKSSEVESLLRAAEFRNDVVRRLKHLTTSIRLDYYQLMDDIEKTQFYAAQQVEAGLQNYQPQRVVLISSTIPKCDKLRAAVKSDVFAHVYDFSSEPGEILDTLRTLLDSVRVGAKAKHIAIVCKGGPGHFYLVKKTPVTPAKLRANQALLSFWRSLGGLMSKLMPGQSVIHLMESNMAGNKQGERLLQDLEAVLYAHQVQVKCPLELAASGREMINLYFDPFKYKLWKTTRYSKLWLY